MTNSFIDYLKECFPHSPEPFESFAESDYNEIIKIIEDYAKRAFDAGAEFEVPHDIGYGLKYTYFEQWKNHEQ